MGYSNVFGIRHSGRERGKRGVIGELVWCMVVCGFQ